MNIILQPCSSRIAQQHYSNAIVNLNLNLDLIKSFLVYKDYQNLYNMFQNDTINIWDVTKNSANKWDKIKIGDIALFAKNKYIFSYGVICYKLKNSQLANFLWGEDEKGQTWENIYFLTELKNTNINYLYFNRAVGYKDNYIIQGFNVLDDEKTNLFLNNYPISSETYMPNVEQSEYFEALKDPLNGLDSVDTKILSNQRKEQNFLRKQLFKNKLYEKCSICGETFPISFLCCSHIKKRCMCSLEEKKRL